MKVTCKRQMLSAAFAAVSGVVPTKTPKSVLTNTRIEAEHGQLTLLATDGDLSIRYVIHDAEIEEAGTVLLPTLRTLNILRELDGDSVTIETLEHNVRIRTDRADYKLGLQNADLFPAVATFQEENYHVIDAAVFRQLIRRTVFAVDTESTRYALGGVLVDLQPGKAVLAATDTRRLSVAEGQCTVHGEPPAPHMPVVPSKAMSLIEKILADDTSQAHLAIRANDMILRGGSATVYSRLVEGRFPRYQDVIPSTCSAKIEIPAEAFLSVVRQAQIVTSEDSRGVDFVFAPGVLTLISQASEIGESKVDLPIAYEGLPITITLDPVFVAEFLRSLDSATIVTVELVDSESAMVLKTADGAVYLVMPLSRDR